MGIGLSGVVSLSISSKPWGLCRSSGVCVGLGFPVCGVGLGGHGSLTIPPLRTIIKILFLIFSRALYEQKLQK